LLSLADLFAIILHINWMLLWLLNFNCSVFLSSVSWFLCPFFM
jgi:hypothetical protein